MFVSDRAHGPTHQGSALSLKLAALCFVLFAVAVLLNEATQSAAGWLAGREIVFAGFRVVAAGAVAWGLFRGARWAWVLGLVLGSLWLVAGLLTVIVRERNDLEWLQPSGFQVFLFASLASLGLAIALLLSPSARQALRQSRV
jgi:hypothetical protein